MQALSRSERGDCIIVACRNVLDNSDWLFCYAHVAGQGGQKRKRILHAWNEVGDVVFDFSNGHRSFLRKEKYYGIAQISEKDVTRQVSEEVRRLMLETETYGGWIKLPEVAHYG